MTARGKSRRGTAQAGFGLIEVIVSAAVLMTVTAGTLALVNGAQRTQATNRDRTVMADLAEQDQERLRSTRVLDVANITQTRLVTVGSIQYKVDSESQWLRDSTGTEVTCTSNTGQAEYLRISSSVAPTNPPPGSSPVKLSSLVTPEVGTYGAGQGTLAVQITNRDGGGQPGIPVAIGPQNSNTVTGTDSTDSNGCAVFNYYPIGAYDVTFSKPGYVNTEGVTDVKISGQINAGVTNTTTPVRYDRAATAVARACTGTAACNQPGSVTTTFKAPINTPQPQNVLTVGNSGIQTAGNVLYFGGTYSATDYLVTGAVTADKLFPFSDGDTFHSGNCSNNNPSTAGGGATYYTAPNTGQYILSPGSTSNVWVFQPRLTIKTKRGSANLANATVYAKEQCGSIYRLGTTDANGTLTESLPWGTYQVCATDGTYEVRSPANPTSSPNNRVAAKGFSPVTVPDLVVPTSGATTKCLT